MHEALQKLRLCAVVAYSKLVLRSRDNRPGKWQDKGFDALGMRDWRKCDLGWLFDKLDEEVAELKKAALDDNEPRENILKEVGDVTNVAMFIADRQACFEHRPLHLRAPKVVCLCGSTRFKEEFVRQNFIETTRGNIVLSVGWFSHADAATYSYTPEEKIAVDELHKRKIDLADEILIINVNGYVGDSTRGEIQYALRTGKTVRWLFPEMVPVDANAATNVSNEWLDRR